MDPITIQPNQNFADAAIAACGTMEAAMALMKANNKSLTEQPDIGVTLTVPTDAPVENGALQYLQQNGILVGTRG